MVRFGMARTVRAAALASLCRLDKRTGNDTRYSQQQARLVPVATALVYYRYESSPV